MSMAKATARGPGRTAHTFQSDEAQVVIFDLVERTNRTGGSACSTA